MSPYAVSTVQLSKFFKSLVCTIKDMLGEVSSWWSAASDRIVSVSSGRSSEAPVRSSGKTSGWVFTKTSVTGSVRTTVWASDTND